MSEVKWIKIVTDIFDDEKILLIESMPEADSIIVIWFKLLCLAGKQNNSGVFQINGRIPYTDEMFATIFRRRLNTVRLALATFQQYGMIEIINDTVTIPNWGKHQQLDQIERNREYMKNYMRKRREEQRLLTEGKSNGKPNDKSNCKTNNKPNVSGADKIREDKKREDIYNGDAVEIDSFSTFYAAYPRKVSKPAAQKAWAKLKPDADLLQAILNDISRRKRGEWAGKDMQYVPHPSTYLNQRRWEDDTAARVEEEVEHDLDVEEIMRRGEDCSMPEGYTPCGGW